MPILLLLRHGIAADPRPGQGDPDRALTPEGWAKTRAAMRGLVALGFRPTRGLTSPYRRARETMDCLREATAAPFPTEAWEGLVPHGRPEAAELHLRTLVAELPDDAVLAITSHQPFLGELVFHLTGRNLDVKKASCTVIGWQDGHWSFGRHLTPAELRDHA